MYHCALFDIDGVLVDIRKSYNAAIKKTVEFVLNQVSGRAFRNLVTDQIILKFRQGGGFNNDTDTCYAIVLAMLANPPPSVAEGRRFLAKVAENADETGINAVERFLSGYDTGRWKRVLGYPAPVKDSMLARIFDEFFYGPELFRGRHHLEPKYWTGGRPFIRNDRRVVSRSTMKTLHGMLGGNLAVVTGRSLLATEYSLGPVMKYLRLDACVFLEDESREHAKPNPYAIKRAMQAMGAKTAVYAGDSAEDLLMARKAEKELGMRISFVGVYGYSPRPAETLAKFKEQGVEAIAKSVSQLPGIIKKSNL